MEEEKKKKPQWLELFIVPTVSPHLEIFMKTKVIEKSQKKNTPEEK